jgi:hypothetical protein
MDTRHKSQPNEFSINSMKLVSFADLLDQQMVRQTNCRSTGYDLTISFHQPSPPASFTQIIEAYVREGRGDVETLKSVLAAKQAEEDVSLVLIQHLSELFLTNLLRHAAHRKDPRDQDRPSSNACS